MVIALVALLTGLLVPALLKGRSAARSTSCLSHLRQLAIASQMYWADNDDRLFPYHFGGDSTGVTYWFGWLGRGDEGARQFDPRSAALDPYLKRGAVTTCPALDYGRRWFKAKAAGAAYGYGYNLHLSRPLVQEELRTSQVRAHSAVVLFADAAQVNTFQAPASPEYPMLEEFYYVNATEPTTHFRHQGKANVVFLDAHVDALAPAPGSVDSRLPAERVGRLSVETLKPLR